MTVDDVRINLIAATLAGALVASGVSAQAPVALPESIPGLLKGYLNPENLPDSLALLPPPPPPPPPPAAGSAAFALDEDVARQRVAQRSGPRWELARLDADLSFPNAAGTFSCALDAPITEQGTPHLYVLLRRMLTDVGLSTYAAKDHYQHERPFASNKEPICTPSEQGALANDGSYPSGHTAVGWAWALVLTEIAPERADAILARCVAYGESRSVCNVHWHSDVVEGRVIGAGAVARLHAEPAFLADVEAAKAEVTAVRAQGAKPSRDCTAEAAALAR